MGPRTDPDGWKEQARQRSLESLRRMETPDPPTASDSDLIGVAIMRLQRAVTKMQAIEYDDELNIHLAKAGEMLGWVAHNMMGRAEESEATS